MRSLILITLFFLSTGCALKAQDKSDNQSNEKFMKKTGQKKKL